MPNTPTARATKLSPSASSSRPSVKRGVPVYESVPTSPSSRPSTIMPSALRTEPCASATEQISPSTMSAKYSAGPNSSASCGERRREQGDDHGREGAGEERAERRRRQRRPGAALPRHLVAVDGRHRRRRFARQVDEDRRGRAAVLRAVIDAGQHDERGRRRQREGDRQQHGDGGGRPDARQDADHRAEQHADEAVEEVERLEGGREAEGEIVEEVHGRGLNPRATGRAAGSAA